MLTFRDFIVAFRKLELGRQTPVVVHTSLSAFGPIQGGADTVVGALLATYETVIMPVFTYKTMVTPEIGPEQNAILYGGAADRNRMAEFFTAEMPADRMMGATAEALRRHPRASRSNHPILSFTGVNAGGILDQQSIVEPLAPIGALLQAGGWVLLLGVDHTVNTSIHYAEQLAGRKQFRRWALMPQGAQECPNFPGCSNGFAAIGPELFTITRRVAIGDGLVQALSLAELTRTVRGMLDVDRMALLCDDQYCERCQQVRLSL